MTDPNTLKRRSHFVLWIVALVGVACVAIVVAAIIMVAQPGPVAAAKRDAIAACHEALTEGNSSFTEASIVEERAFTSMDWQDYQRAIEAHGYGGHTHVDDRSADEIAETDAVFTELRGAGEETVWVVWDLDGGDLWQCVATLQDGEVLGRPVLSGPPME
jgi:hypothetical protein